MLDYTDLHGYQLTSKDHIIRKPFCGLFLDMGLGKTVSALTAIDELMFDRFEVNKVLVIAPKRVASGVWSDEVESWAHLQHLRIISIQGSAKQREKQLKEPADIYTIGRDNTAWLCNHYGSNLPFDMVVIDESSSFKNHQSVRFKALKLAIRSVKRVVILTGTPAPNSLIDLWPQIYLLDKGERLERNISKYRRLYFTPGQTNGHIVYNYRLQKGKQEEIYNKINDICISMKSEDYLQLPGTVVKDIKVKFPSNIQKLYDDFEKEQVLSLDEDINAVNAAALSNKLLQFANGAVYDEDRNVHEVHDLKLEACRDIIEEAQGKPVLIAWTYQHDRDRLLKTLKQFNPRQLKTDQDIKDWNAGKIQVLMMHPASGGHGLNLQKGGNIIVWFGQTWSLELLQQFNKRLDRQGQTEIVTINRIISCDTIDQDVIKSNERKATGQNALLDAVKARIDKYKGKAL